jgi:type VI secretion system protein ImpH
MATESRRTDPSVEELLFTEGFRFEFFQAVRLLERTFPERAPVGRDAHPADEIVRFRSRNSLTFPASSIHDLSRAEDDGLATMLVAFMGLTGPSGVLPRHYTELLLERERQRDRAMAEFFDIFNHRAISLFYRAWQKYRVPIAHEQATRLGAVEDPFTQSLYAHFGMATPGLRGALEIEDQTFLFYAGLLAQQPRSAVALEGMLADYFGMPVKVGQFVGEWLPLTDENRSRLGQARRPGEDDRGAHNVMGRTAVLGRRFWDQQARLRLRLGPLTFEQFSELLPSGRQFGVLVQLARFFVGQGLDFDIQLVLKADEVPACRVGGLGPRAPRLGWSTWLAGPPRTRDADNTMLGRHWMRRSALPGRASVRRAA